MEDSQGSSVRDQINLTVSLPGGLGSIPSHGRVFQMIFPGESHSDSPFGARVAENGSIFPQLTPRSLWTARRKAKFNYGQMNQNT